MTAPGGTPLNKAPIAAPIAPPRALVQPTTSRPPSSAQNTLSPPRTVGGRTARLLRGNVDDEEAPGDSARVGRPRVQDRSGRGRPPVEVEDDDDQETARIAAKAQARAKAKAPPSGRGGTLRMDGGEQPSTETAPPGGAFLRQAPPAPRPPPLRVRGEDDPPSTARGGSSRDLQDFTDGFPVAQAPSARREAAAKPAAAAPLAAPVVAPAPAPVVVAAPVVVVAAAPAPVVTPAGEITISASEFEQTAITAVSVESRWPFAFAVGAVSLAIGSLLPLPFRQYIVPEHLDSSAAPSASAPAIPSHDLVQQPTATTRATSPLSPATVGATSAGMPPVFVAPTTSTAPRTAPFGSVKTPKPNQGTPRDVF